MSGLLEMRIVFGMPNAAGTGRPEPQPVQAVPQLLYDHYLGHPARAAYGALHCSQHLSYGLGQAGRVLHRAFSHPLGWKGECQRVVA